MFFNKILRQNLEFQIDDALIINCYSFKDIINLVKKHEFFIEKMKIVGKPTFTIRKGLKSWFYNNLFVRSWNIFPFLSKLFGGCIYVKIKKKYDIFKKFSYEKPLLSLTEKEPTNFVHFSRFAPYSGTELYHNQ